MSRVVVINHLTLDGVMQAPGHPEEDTRDGFVHGGWAAPNVDEVMNAAMGARMGSGGLLLGRRSYERMLSYWNTQDSPFKDMLNSATSTSPRGPCASRCPGRTRRSCTETSQTPWRSSSRRPGRICSSWAAAS